MSFNNHSTAPILGIALSILCSTAQRADADDGNANADIEGKVACDEGSQLANQPGKEALAILFLERCHRTIPSRETRELMHDVRKKVRKTMANAAPVSLALTPETARATLVDSRTSPHYSGQQLFTEDELWLPKGHYEIAVTAPGFEGGRFAIVVDSTDRILIPITLKAQASPQNTDIDMTEDRGAELGQVASAADPRPKEFKTLLADRYHRAPTPTPLPQLQPSEEERSPWPYVTLGLGVAAVATGIGFHVADHTRPAFIAYGSGAVLGGVASYLFLRTKREAPKNVAVQVIPGGAVLGFTGSL